MTDPAHHLEQAQRNLDHAQLLLRMFTTDPTAIQWAVTAAFYCGVHCIQAYMLQRNLDPRNHMERARLIADPSNGVPMDVQTAYEFLKQRSESARYRLGQFDPAYVHHRILGHYLQRITNFVGL